MSLFIDQANPFFYHLYSTSPHITKTPNSYQYVNGNLAKHQYQQIVRYLGNMADYLFDIIETQKLITLHFDFTKLRRNFSVILSVEINRKTKQSEIYMTCLGPNDNFLRVVGKQRMKIICKWLTSQFLITEFNLNVSINNGQIRIKVPLFYRLSYKQPYKHLFSFLNHLKNRLSGSIQQIHRLLDIVSGMCLDSNNISLYQRVKLNKQNFGMNYWLNKYINTYVYICSQSAHQETSVQNQLIKQFNSIQKIKKNYIPFGSQISSIQFYQPLFNALISKKQIQQLRIQMFQKKKIKARIQMPSLQKSKNPQQNGYVLNYIKTKKSLDEYPGKVISSGGFSSIKVMDIDYWYISSSNVGTAKMMEEIQGVEPLSKRIIVKREKQKSNQEGYKSRINHQRFILSRIKNGLSIFLPQYYLLAEKDHGHQKHLLSDFINYPNLYEYCQKFKLSNSFHTKIFFSIIIAQGIRYLSQYRIAHLDLKPTNIMTNKKLNLKLIDFGQSYHPQLIGNAFIYSGHEPGFTMPYSAPQNYKGCERYTYKNDIFSLGVIMYELFIGKYPFYLNDPKLEEKVYREQRFQDYWFHVSQQNLMNGESVVFPLIESIIVKCLHPSPECRPELQWIVYLLRNSLDYFY